MDNFNNIIKQTAEQFEVPFNDAHWTEMDAKLNGIQSKKKKSLFLGSAAVVITIALSAFFLFPNNTTTNLNSSDKTATKKTTENTKTVLDQPILSDKETINENIITEEISSEAKPKEVIVTKEKIATTSPKIVAKETKNISPIVVAEKREILTPTLKPKTKSTVIENDLKLKTSEIAPMEEKTLESSSLKTVNTIKPLTAEPILPSTASADRIKSVRHKAYEDENVSKKSIKRRRRGILSFISFKKKRYKVPLSRSKPSKKKK